MIYNLSSREARLLLRTGSASFIEMEPAWDDDRQPRPPAEPLLLCRREGDQYCLAAAATAGWQVIARCRILSIVRRDVRQLDENEARHIMMSLPVLSLGKSYRRALAHWWQRQGIAGSRILLFRVALDEPVSVPQAAAPVPAATQQPTELAVILAAWSFILLGMWLLSR